ncbi:hypothetical protein [Filimonas lacunae]|nr:hypothetical protein [Filimonas lacunae]BAV05237.1 hypothetical protein FLA_1244 [Filimonas lacunae]
MNAKTTADLTVTSPATNEKLQTITTSQYTTSDNVGTMVFSADKIDSKGIGYTAYGTINVTGYYNGAYDPDQSIDNMEFSQAVDPTTVSYAYQAVGSDSLYLSSGALVNVTDGTTTVGGGASGCKYTIKNDTLSIISRSNVNQNSTSSGITYKALGTVYAEMKLVKE